MRHTGRGRYTLARARITCAKVERTTPKRRRYRSFATMKSIKAKLQSRKASGGLLGAELTELAKTATAKDVPAPNEELNQMVRDRAHRCSDLMLRPCRHCNALRLRDGSASDVLVAAGDCRS